MTNVESEFIEHLQSESLHDKPSSSLIIIGGNEDKKGSKKILREIAKRSQALVICTLSTVEPEERFNLYAPIFQQLGVREIRHWNRQSNPYELLDGADGVLLTGGDQRRYSDTIVNNDIQKYLVQMWHEGDLKVLAGTSSGAAIMGFEASAEDEVIPGLAVINAHIDQHLSQRHRLPRLEHRVLFDSGMPGYGFDEDAAGIFGNGNVAVVGNGNLYMVNRQESALSVTVLHPGETAQLAPRTPYDGTK